MDYPSKVVYNGILVDVADIVCPGTELAHYSVGNLKKMINSLLVFMIVNKIISMEFITLPEKNRFSAEFPRKLLNIDGIPAFFFRVKYMK